MPMYEYICQECEHPFETLVFGGETVECPKCRSQRLERLLSVPAAPKTEATSRASALNTACRSSGPPCGPACSRWQ
jgi:putative FmdB family regulatory protein